MTAVWDRSRNRVCVIVSIGETVYQADKYNCDQIYRDETVPSLALQIMMGCFRNARPPITLHSLSLITRHTKCVNLVQAS